MLMLHAIKAVVRWTFVMVDISRVTVRCSNEANVCVLFKNSAQTVESNLLKFFFWIFKLQLNYNRRMIINIFCHFLLLFRRVEVLFVHLNLFWLNWWCAKWVTDNEYQFEKNSLSINIDSQLQQIMNIVTVVCTVYRINHQIKFYGSYIL